MTLNCLYCSDSNCLFIFQLIFISYKLLTFTVNLVRKPFECQPRAELNTSFLCVYKSDPLPTALNLIGPRAMDVLAELSYVSMTPDHFPSMFCKVGNND